MHILIFNITPVFVLIPYFNSTLGKGCPHDVHNSPYFVGEKCRKGSPTMVPPVLCLSPQQRRCDAVGMWVTVQFSYYLAPQRI